MKVYVSAFGVKPAEEPIRECLFLESPSTVREFLALLEKRYHQGLTEESRNQDHLFVNGKLSKEYSILINGRFCESLDRLLNDEDKILVITLLSGG